MNLKAKIGNNIKKIRNEKNILQNDLALKIGVKRPYLSNVERGLTNLTIDSLEKIASALDVDIIVLLS